MISRRLQKEIVHLKDTTLQDTGIFYFIQDELMTRGTAIMFGPENTPYEFCPLEYTFEIPNDYPFTPPKVLYRTNNGKTRFHPNFYVDGKVCLSILGTYSGPKWASSMNITTILLSIYSLMTNNPLVHEPCWENTLLTDTRNLQYAQHIEYNMIKLFIQQYNDKYYKKYMEINEEFKNRIEENYIKITKKVIEKSKKDEIHFIGLPYSMYGDTNYKLILNKISKN